HPHVIAAVAVKRHDLVERIGFECVKTGDVIDDLVVIDTVHEHAVIPADPGIAALVHLDGRGQEGFLELVEDGKLRIGIAVAPGVEYGDVAVADHQKRIAVEGADGGLAYERGQAVGGEAGRVDVHTVKL